MVKFFAHDVGVFGELIVDAERYSIEIPKMQADGKTFLPSNYIVYCQLCGTVWAERRVDHPQAGRWWAKSKPCSNCGHGFLWDEYDESWNRSLPYELLARELDLICMYAEHAANYQTLFPPTNFARTGYG